MTQNELTRHEHAQPNIPVLYEDNHVLAVVKPVNVPTQEDASGDPDLLSLLKEDLKIRHNKPGNVFLGLVHRLDRPVGGAMIFAKTSKAASRLSESVRSRHFHKLYTAVLNGVPTAPQGRLTHYLLKDSRTNTVQAVRPGTAGAKEAILEYRMIGQADGLSLVQIKLHTGRSHQIRVQMQAIGCPLYGDQKYGGNLSRPGQQLALWSLLAGAPHPVSKDDMRFHSLPPVQFPWNEWPRSLYENMITSEI
ncbi:MULTISPECIES: RluA family pseudouridine synthase [Paenibacillus]|jgi:23S rRNA pseudouridine1911/1915/1917 synthase|uniref:RNA pseudouridylate synthase n=2 Tax=Paenibacillus TaxID=44249 RepID=A0AAJ3IWM0_PAEPO|nr:MULTISPECIES: RluA family pseudouridine synthase [Paenibacillus]AIW40363.1 pseudouridine synthase [Paenibacillus polymyxa CR1]ALA42636.1 pseudouridine synthase [Paenibacillus peoriae]APB75565.1 RluA family pseudouridine synthase [Paenibacillus polymyxa]APQ59907.1 pseudouridine synthase [Paenibacillus polymyxa]MCP3743128.1 RluA family pseudouridine synthase [Paenibacillus sp. A3M_27_13]